MSASTPHHLTLKVVILSGQVLTAVNSGKIAGQLAGQHQEGSTAGLEVTLLNETLIWVEAAKE